MKMKIHSITKHLELMFLESNGSGIVFFCCCFVSFFSTSTSTRCRVIKNLPLKYHQRRRRDDDSGGHLFLFRDGGGKRAPPG